MPFTDLHRTILRSSVDRVIPPDDYPGAWDAGVGDFIVHLFDTDMRDDAPAFLAGLEALDAEASARHGVSFSNLTAAQQDELLRHVEAGDVRAAWPVSARAFFARLVHLTAEGYYSDPGNGGNRDMLAWKMIGYDPRGQTPPPAPPPREGRRA